MLYYSNATIVKFSGPYISVLRQSEPHSCRPTVSSASPCRLAAPMPRASLKKPGEGGSTSAAILAVRAVIVAIVVVVAAVGWQQLSSSI